MRKLTNRALFICFALMTSFCLIAPATALRSYAQEGGGSTLEGLIKDDSGPLLGATVIVKNTTRGTTTDMDGKFRLEGLQPGDVLQVTYVGYDPYEVTYTGQTTLDILMTTTANQLNAVVVTAMGIERQSKTLSYAAETVGGDDVADIKSVNMINALQGKAAGLQITPNSTHATHPPPKSEAPHADAATRKRPFDHHRRDHHSGPVRHGRGFAHDRIRHGRAGRQGNGASLLPRGIGKGNRPGAGGESRYRSKAHGFGG